MTLNKKTNNENSSKTTPKLSKETDLRNDFASKNYVFNPQDKVFQIAQVFGITSAVLIKKLLQLGLKADVNQTLEKDIVELLAKDYNIQVSEPQEKQSPPQLQPQTPSLTKTKPNQKLNLQKKSPIVTIMGHVDHGKTTLLDAIRKTRVVDQEFGGITQHIGAYQVEYQGNKITFIDTPGHEAFDKMRARGAKITDICILVVAVDDCVKPQTLEALKHAQEAQIPIIVALNKIDKPNNNTQQIMQELSSYDLLPEEWGGTTPYIAISALKREGLEKILEIILLVSEIQNLQANPDQKAQGTVIEASLDKSLGLVATFIVSDGNLKVGDIVVAGASYGKIRSMEDENKKTLTKALPSQPVRVAGLKEVPQAGDIFYAVANEKQARQIVAEKKAQTKETLAKTLSPLHLEDILQDLETEKPQELNIILKADTQGSLEALQGMIAKIKVSDLKVQLLRAAVGTITETDIAFAKSSDSFLIGFNIKPASSTLKSAQRQEVKITIHNVIYRIIEDIEQKLKSMIKPIFEEVVTGKVEVRKIFNISKVGNIAGCYVTQGIVNNSDFAKVMRNDEVLFKGKIASLKHLKDNIKSAKQGYECGILLNGFNDFEINDIIETSKLSKVEE
ncbi:MAG: translation initiation factor IF-2 [Candidatus Phytoplasma asteris]|uniref:Translation initiation factor IF-2 n=1 Tax='Chrysanthemum coronarium' phytoplasma TaxID=1520703 RepID=A0ABQ0J2I0_9MOLU|nr:translation initiation factor IF-2 ['Chrysanthemum coronarium' phytoplasma]TKA87645.1 MAG: translation initiation factor IF-2 [Periwinkle leaf yellowing phytoplasma]WEX20006.1 MAG: translation initiation factor IF-2 [Candidatus Phytoplasma asteris]GAK73810.1 translation initiation factor 2 ['Chrysanthemum coronarium' phytoplasma]